MRAAAIEAALTAQTGRAVRVCGLQQLAGGASQEAWSLDVTLGEPGPAQTHELVMRRDMGGSLTFLAVTRDAEFAILRAAHAGGVPVPQPFFAPVEIDGKRAFFMQRVSGEAVGRRLVQGPAFAHARAVLPGQLAQALAAIHRVDYRAAQLERLVQHPAAGARAIDIECARLYRELDSLEEPHPALEIALRWLHLHRPPEADESVLVHGDFRIGNVLVGEDGLHAVLDWEFTHIGDPYEDISWFLVRAWRFGATALEGGGICERETWLRAYENASGRSLDRTTVAYWEILGNVKWAIGASMQAHRHLSGVEPSIELASLGRIAAEMEHEALSLIVR
ncbi:MAG: phosphotransferase family protein [Candidatus Velthaea sp.]